MTDIELAALVEQYTGLTDRHSPAYAQAYRLAHAVATAAHGNRDPGDTPQYRALQEIIDDLLDTVPTKTLEDINTPEGLLLNCLSHAMIRYEQKYWPLGDHLVEVALPIGERGESRKDLPSPTEDGQ